jgi:hypothetical protein
LAGLAALTATAATAGPPYITDDPEPTDTGHFENYLFSEGTRAAGRFSGEAAGIEINYGACADTQLTVSVPLDPNPGPGGMGLVWAPLGGGVKYRLIEEDDDGWRPQVAIFPQISVPVGSAARSSPTTWLLPLWLQKTEGTWSTFGGGGLTLNPGSGNRNYAIYGWALQRQLSDTFALGVEFFGQSRSSVTMRGSAAAGLGALYDLSEAWHIIGSVNTGITDRRQADVASYNLALKWTL